MERDKKDTASKNETLREHRLQDEYNIRTNDSAKFIEKLPDDLIKMNLEDVLKEVKEIDSRCDFEKCKTRTSLIGQNCDFCKKRYCFKHNLPEVHGCNEEIKRHERKEFMKPQTAKQKQQEKDTNAAKKRLDAKLKDMKVSRMQKTSGTIGKNKKS